MGTNKTQIRIELSQEERSQLERLSRSQAVPHRIVVRATLVLLLAAGSTLSAVGSCCRARWLVADRSGWLMVHQRACALAG